MTEHPSRLRYVDADQLDSRVLDLDGLDVRNHRGEHIGDVEGLLIDSVTGRPRYLVIDSGGWFRSRRFLLPIPHAQLDADRRALRVNFDKDTINRFPEMRTDRYDAITDEELQQYDDGVWRASGVTRTQQVGGTEYDTSPTWWDSNAWASTSAETPRTTGRTIATEEVLASSEDVVRARAERERTLAHEREGLRDRARRDRDDVRAPAPGGRAQPGDILGIESAGETTSIGDTAADEDKRRERAERNLRDVKIVPDDQQRHGG